MSSDISVLMPCYRIDSWLKESLESIEDASKNLNVELIIVANNMIPQEIKEIISLSRDSFSQDCTVIDGGEVDLVGALNIGIKNCNSKLIARMDQDDIMLPERLQRQFDFLELNPEVSLVGGCVEVIDTSGDYLALQTYPISSEEIKSQLRFGNCFAHPVVMYRKSAILEIGLYNPVFTQAEDFAMYIAMSKKFQFVNLPDVLLKYRINPNQTSQKGRTLQELSTRAVILHAAIDSIFRPEEFMRPKSNNELEAWFRAIQKYIKSNIFSIRKVDRNRAFLLLDAQSRSHIALARSSGYPGKRRYKKIFWELLLAFAFNPIGTMKWLLSSFL